MPLPSTPSISGRDASVCRDLTQRSMLLQYAFVGCREDEEVAFEAHLLECTPCFDDLRTLDRAAQLIEETEQPEVELRAILRRSRR